MDYLESETSKQLAQIEKQYKDVATKWKNSRTSKDKSKYWIEMHRLDGIRSNLLLKRQKEIEEDLDSRIVLSDGSAMKKRHVMEIQRHYGLTDEEVLNYIPLACENSKEYPFDAYLRLVNI